MIVIYSGSITASLNRECPICSANFGVGKGHSAVQFAQEALQSWVLRSAVLDVGVRRQMHLIFDCGPIPTLLQTTIRERFKCGTSPVGSKATSGMKLPDVKNHATHEMSPMRLLGMCRRSNSL